jgi:hypothetical protein
MSDPHRRFSPLCVTLALVVLTGCGTTFLGKGQGLATGERFRAAEELVLKADADAAPGCNRRSVTYTEVVSDPRVAVTPYDQVYTHSLPDASRPTQSPGVFASGRQTTYSEFTERWTVDRCGGRVHYLVTFRPDGKIKVVPE